VENVNIIPYINALLVQKNKVTNSSTFLINFTSGTDRSSLPISYVQNLDGNFFQSNTVLAVIIGMKMLILFHYAKQAFVLALYVTVHQHCSFFFEKIEEIWVHVDPD
jgi:hypothetical protein